MTKKKAKKTQSVKKKTSVAQKKVSATEVKTEVKAPVKVVVSADKKTKRSSLKNMAVNGLRKISMPTLKKEVNLRPLLPNFVTMSALACGLSSIH
ncbi:MAG: hypothetical protein ILP11_03960, partial [Alphaproteobacteria bacterium]|nr:hypothetical protein [Alphaproteobacteria bacterium]